VARGVLPEPPDEERPTAADQRLPPIRQPAGLRPGPSRGEVPVTVRAAAKLAEDGWPERAKFSAFQQLGYSLMGAGTARGRMQMP
jgi:hypothetical protein